MMLPVDFLVIFVQNLIFQHMIGLPGLGFTGKNGKGLLRLGLLTLLFSTVCCGMIAYIRPLLPETAGKFMIPLCTAVLAGCLDLLLLLVSKPLPKLHKRILPVLHNAAFSGTLLGAVMLSTEYTHDPAVAWRFGFQTGTGFLAACIMLKAAAPFFNSKQMPDSLRGRRGLFLYAAIISMAPACMFPAA
ncbi:MAG: hypothetical protein IKQ91_00490 [Oscillospiraceae bacterium]|nr:hypothetical protein [Oscillospiraceae bacterium]